MYPTRYNTPEEKYKISIYKDDNGYIPFIEWIDSLKDKEARYTIKTRLNRLTLGNFGDCETVGNGVSELRIHHGPGYRVYQDIVFTLYRQDLKSFFYSAVVIKAHRNMTLKMQKNFGRNISMPTAIDYNEYLIESLKEPEEAAGYLNAALADGEIDVFLLALKQVAIAHGGLGQLAETTQKSRNSLYKTLSKNGNPYLESTQKILNAMGFTLTVKVAK